MITALLALLQPGAQVVELPDPTAKTMRIEIVASLGKLDRSEWACVAALPGVLRLGTQNFTRFQLLDATAAAGDPLRISVGPDHMRIGFSVRPNDAELAFQVADELIRSASLPDEETQSAVDELPFRRRSPWAEAWLPLTLDNKGVKRADVAALYHKVFRPGNVTVALGGAVAPGQGGRLTDRLRGWKAVEARRRFAGPDPTPLSSRSGPLSTVAFESPSFSIVPTVSADGVKTDLPALMLATAMMGSGKGATLFEVLRQKNGWSYRQEAYLVGTGDGVRASAVMALDTAPGPIADKSRSALLAAVEKWSHADRDRAIALARANIDLNLGLGFLDMGEERPLGDSLEDRTFLAAYWKSKTGKTTTLSALLDEMTRATLDEAKKLATRWLKEGTTRVIVGAGGVPGG